MKAILLSIAAVFAATLGYGQDPVSIRYPTPIEAKVPLEFSYHNGSSMVKKEVDVILVVENFTAYHTPINSFADGGLAGGFKCDIVFNTWFSYSSPKGFTVDNEFVSFDELGIKGINFSLKNVRFQWIQGVYGSYRWYSMGSPLLPTSPKGDKPGYTGSIYLQLKEMIGDHGSCAKDVEVVKGKGPIFGNALDIEELTFTPPYELKNYLRRKEEKIIREEKEFKDRLYNSSGSGSDGPVLTRSSNSSSASSSSGTSRSSNSRTSSSNNSSNSSSETQKSWSELYFGRMSPAEKLEYYRKEAQRLKKIYGRYGKEEPKQRSIYDSPDPAEVAKGEAEKRAAEEKKQKAQGEKLEEQRNSIMKEFPVTLHEARNYSVKNAQRLYFFLYVHVGIDYRGYVREMRHLKSKMVTSNVFSIEVENNQINGAILRKDIELSINRQLAKNNGEDERYEAEKYATLRKYIVGPYGTEKDAQLALAQFKNRLAGTGVSFYDVQFAYNQKAKSELLTTAIGLFKGKSYTNALEHFKRIAMENPNDPTLYVYMARCQYELKPREGAYLNSQVAQYCVKAMQKGADGEDYYQIGNLYYRYKFNNCPTYDFEAVWCFTKAAGMGHEKAIAWLEKNQDLADEVLIYYDTSYKKYGIRNLQNKAVVNAEYDKIKLFSKGKFIVGKDKKEGIIDKAGNVILPVKYESILPCKEGLNVIKADNGLYGYINSAGVIVVQPEYYYADSFEEGLAAVASYRRDLPAQKQYGFIDTTGKLVIPHQFRKVYSFAEGLAAVQICDDNNDNCNWGYINKKGELVIPATFSYADKFKKGKAYVSKKRRSFYIDKNGKKVKN